MKPLNILTAENVSKTYGEKRLFSAITFGVDESDRIGLIGLNGTGKSTLLKIVAGLIPPDSGTITRRHGLRVQYLAQEPTFPEGATVLEAIFAGANPAFQVIRTYEEALLQLEAQPDDARAQRQLADRQLQMDAQQLWAMEAQAKAILSRLGITTFGKPVEALSGGQRKRVALAQALIHPADLLILDEPTNHIDNLTVDWLEAQLARFPGALILITHDRYFLDRVVTQTFELDGSELYRYEGNYRQFLELKEARMASAAVREERRQNILRRELAWLHRGAKARSTKQKARIERVHDLLEQRPESRGGQVEIGVGSHRLGKEIIRLEGVSKGFGGEPLFRDFTYNFVADDRVGIVGPNGVGKSTLLNLIAGRIEPDAGSRTQGQTVRLAYYGQESEEMDPEQRVIAYIKDVAEVVQTADGSTITAAQMLERFLFPPKVQWTEIGKLSGGERRRLYLLKTLMTEPNVLLLDEPTNDLDIETLAVLEEYLEQFPGVVVAVSHDRYFLDRVAEQLFCFEEGRIRRYMGSCSEYMEEQAAATGGDVGKPDGSNLTGGRSDDGGRRQRGASASPQTSGAPPEGEAPRRHRATLKLSFKEQREWETIEERIAGLEAEAARLETAMEEAATDYARLQELSAEHQRAQAELGRAMDRWAELAEKVEAIEQERKG